ncbi:MAG: prephenate dehydrogenase/arogenate dehydrogenase family protein, partial [FCB group bacterium]|nr:prephenate dehydrogenase/arogenate dehydrogenase family protein [FCB group bacterium]
MKAAFIGLGLIGGSMAKRLKASGLIQTAIGVDTNPEHARIALENGIVNRIDNLESAIDQADFIVLSVPVSSAKNLITAVLDRIQKGSVVIDTGSTKLSICKKASYHQNRDQFVAFHPIAGTEYSGPNAADENLFSGKLCIICEQDRSSSSSLAKVLEMIEHLGMEVIHMNAEEHDRHLAYVSHLSHITSFTLGLTVLEIEKNEKNIFNLAGSGFS